MHFEALLPQAELAQLFNVSERTLERWRVEGTGPAFLKLGRRVLYRPEDVNRWLHETARRSTSDAKKASSDYQDGL